jgi:cbb3-type cytochrome oxidase subunit 3
LPLSLTIFFLIICFYGLILFINKKNEDW